MLKLLPLSFLVVFALCANCAFAKIWRLNNNPGGVNADFTSLQAAHDGAAGGDTLYLEGSPNNYGGFNCSKKLVIIGPGYYLEENNIANVNTISAKISSSSMNAGSEGSEIMGLDFGTYYININTSDIVIKRNLFASASGDVPDYNTGYINLGSGANNVLILQNYSVQINGANDANTGILIANNVISYGAYWGGESNQYTSLHLHPFTSAVIQNNIFRRGIVRAHRATFTNNIMVNGVFEKNENMTSNNIGNSTQFGTENGNKSNVDMGAVFVGTGSPDARWKLKTGSPAVGAGYGSTTAKPIDAGMFGGNTAYRLSGLPGIPVIYFINVQGVGSNTDPIDVTVKVRSTN